MRNHLYHLLLTLALLAMTLPASLALAQEEAEAAAETVATGYESATTIMLLLGIAAVFAVSIFWYTRERNAPNGDETGE